jgi:hypothetical protein
MSITWLRSFMLLNAPGCMGLINSRETRPAIGGLQRGGGAAEGAEGTRRHPVEERMGQTGMR